MLNTDLFVWHKKKNGSLNLLSIGISANIHRFSTWTSRGCDAISSSLSDHFLNVVHSVQMSLEFAALGKGLGAHVTGIRPFSYNRMHFSTFCGDMKSESYLNKVRKNACHKNKLVYYLYECVREPSIAGLVWRICRKFDMQMVFPLNESAR